MTSWLRRLYFFLAYFSQPPWDTGISPPELMAYIRANPPGRALDLGCGTGTNVITLAREGWQVTGVDFVPSAIRAARRKARQAGVTVNLFVEDVTRLSSIVGPFDLVLDIGCMHGLSPKGKSEAIERIAGLLAPQGIYLLYAFLVTTGAADIGLTAADLDNLSSTFNLVERVDGLERGVRPSAWFTFRKNKVE